MKIVSVKNLMTNEDLLRAVKNSNPEIVEIGRQNIVFDLAITQQNFHANLLLKGVIPLKGKEVPFQFIGKVVSNETFDHAVRLNIDLVQYDKQLWMDFLHVGQEEQERADRIFNSIREDE